MTEPSRKRARVELAAVTHPTLRDLVQRSTLAGQTVDEAAMRLFNVTDYNSLTPATVQANLDEWEQIARAEYRSMQMSGNADLNAFTTMLRFMEHVTLLGDHLLLCGQLHKESTAPIDPAAPQILHCEDTSSISILLDTDSEKRPHQYGCFCIRLHAKARGYRKFDGEYYSPMYNDADHFMNYYEYVGPMEKLTSIVTNRPTVSLATSNMCNVISKLSSSVSERNPDPFFPELNRDKRVFSFNNGVIDLRVNRNDPDKKVAFYPYGTDQPPLPDSASFRPYDINPEWVNPRFRTKDIPTPTVDKVIADQGYDSHYASWILALLGRVFFDIGELDDWQVMLYMHGLAGTGKSTLITLLQDLYDSDDVYSIHSNFEDRFGLASITDKFIWVAPDVKEVFPLDRALLQSMVTGESIGIPKKFKMARSKKWTVPGLMAGNRLPNYNDTAGSVIRRLVMMRFTKVVERDDTLTQRIKEECGAFLIKSVRYYFEKLTTTEIDFWKAIPEEFLKAQTFLRKHLDAAYCFVKSDKISEIIGAYVPVDEFVDELRKYSAQNGISLPRGFAITIAEDLLREGITTDYGNYAWPPNNSDDSTCRRVFLNITSSSHSHYFHSAILPE